MHKVHSALPEAVRQLMNKVRRTLAAALERRGLNLTPPEAHILLLIQAHPGLSPLAIVSLTGHDKAVVTRKIKTMENDGLLIREKDPDDQRRLRLSLTPAGVGCCQHISAARQEAHGAVFDALSDQEQQQLVELLHRCL